MDSPEAGKDLAVQSFLTEIKDWNVMGILPEGLELADGKKVRDMRFGKPGFYDHGTRFSDLHGGGFPYELRRDYHDTDKNINILSILPYKDGSSVVVYNLKWLVKDINPRYREFGDPANVQFLMSDQAASRLRDSIRKDTTLMDRIIAAKFPELVQNRQIVPWKQLVLCPVDTKRPSHLEGNNEVIATR